MKVLVGMIILFLTFFFYGCERSVIRQTVQQQPDTLHKNPVISFLFKDSVYTILDSISCRQRGYFAISGTDRKSGITFEIDLYTGKLYAGSEFYSIFSVLDRKANGDTWYTDIGLSQVHANVTYKDDWVVSGNFSGTLSDSTGKIDSLSTGYFQNIPIVQ